MEKEELMVLVREYIDVFVWNYEDMPGLDPQVAMHRLNIKPDVKDFIRILWKLLKLKSITHRVWFHTGGTTSRLGC